MEQAHANGYIREFTSKEGRKLFDDAAKYYLGLSGEEFLKRLNDGEFEDPDEYPELAEVLALVPFARS